MSRKATEVYQEEVGPMMRPERLDDFYENEALRELERPRRKVSADDPRRVPGGGSRWWRGALSNRRENRS